MTKEESKRKTFVTSNANTTKEKNVTLLAAFGADGKQACPSAYFIAQKTFDNNVIKRCPPIAQERLQDVEIVTGNKGYNSKSKYKDYCINNLLPTWRKRFPDLTKKLLLLYDGATCHNLETELKVAMATNNIILVKLLPNTSLVAQPLDIGLFATLKGKFSICSKI